MMCHWWAMWECTRLWKLWIGISIGEGSEEYAKRFVDHVFRLHSRPKVIIFDWGPHFTSKFWKSLFDLLGMDLQFSMAFHP